MTIPTDPVKAARALARHVRNSHAIGKVVVDTALRGVTGKARGGSSGAPQAPVSDSPAPSEPAVNRIRTSVCLCPSPSGRCSVRATSST